MALHRVPLRIMLAPDVVYSTQCTVPGYFEYIYQHRSATYSGGDARVEMMIGCPDFYTSENMQGGKLLSQGTDRSAPLQGGVTYSIAHRRRRHRRPGDPHAHPGRRWQRGELRHPGKLPSQRIDRIPPLQSKVAYNISRRQLSTEDRGGLVTNMWGHIILGVSPTGVSTYVDGLKVKWSQYGFGSDDRNPDSNFAYPVGS